MASIWVIEQGTYSDYHVVGVFSSEEHAKLVMDTIASGEHEWEKVSIAEWPLDPGVAELHSGLTLWQIEMLRDGTVQLCVQTDVSQRQVSTTLELAQRWVRASRAQAGSVDYLEGVVWAYDQQHAIKIFNERRAQLIAEGRW